MWRRWIFSRQRCGPFWTLDKYMSFPFATVGHFEQAGLVCGTEQSQREKSVLCPVFALSWHNSLSKSYIKEQVHEVDRNGLVVCVLIQLMTHGADSQDEWPKSTGGGSGSGAKDCSICRINHNLSLSPHPNSSLGLKAKRLKGIPCETVK